MPRRDTGAVAEVRSVDEFRVSHGHEEIVLSALTKVIIRKYHLTHYFYFYLYLLFVNACLRLQDICLV